MRRLLFHCLELLFLAASTSGGIFGADPVLVPQIDGDFWQIAGNPDLGKYTLQKQQPVDFGIWQAADGTWQLWSCLRSTATPGKTRLLYRWQANRSTDRDWAPMGIAMMADPNFGETEGGLQAPFVLKEGSDYYMFYGDWEHIAMAKSEDGKTFARQPTPEGKSGMFGEDAGNNTRDPMVIKIGSLYYIYYTAYRDGHGFDFARTSKDLLHWSEPVKVAYESFPKVSVHASSARLEARMESLPLSCRALSSPTICRFIPAVPVTAAVPEPGTSWSTSADS